MGIWLYFLWLVEKPLPMKLYEVTFWIEFFCLNQYLLFGYRWVVDGSWQNTLKVTVSKRMKVKTNSCVNTDGQPGKWETFIRKLLLGSNKKKLLKLIFKKHFTLLKGEKDFFIWPSRLPEDLLWITNFMAKINFFSNES